MALITANLVVLLALVFAFPQLMVSPGALSKGHTKLATDCFSCHAPLRGASSPRCISCHAVADVGLRTTGGVAVVQRGTKTSFHQDLIEQDCVACHSDHQGPKLTQRSRKPFSHALLQPAVRSQCSHCHTPPADKLHSGSPSQACAQCHSPERWKPARVEHDKLFVLDRDHNASCVTCHTGSDFRSYTCYGCHEHEPDKVRAKHLKEGITDFTNCVECHRNASDEPQHKGSREKGRRD